jgi:hypothetical protein
MAASTSPLPTTHFALLDQLCVPELQALVRKLIAVFNGGIKVLVTSPEVPKRKGDCVGFVLRSLQTDEQLRRLFAALSSNERLTLAEIVHNEPMLILDRGRYAATHGQRPAIPSDSSSAKIGLLHAVLSPYGSIPPDLVERLRPIAEKPAPPAPHYAEEPPPALYEELAVQLHATEEAACHDVMAVLQLIAQGAVRVSPATGIITEASADAVRAVLLTGDYYPPALAPDYDDDVSIGRRGIRPFAWPLLLQAGGLAAAQGGKLILTSAGEKSLTKPAHELLQKLWGRWVKFTGFHEFSRLEEIKGQKSAKSPLAKPNAGRQALADTLALLAVDRWIALDDFFTYMFSMRLNYTVVRDHWALYRTDPNYGSFGTSNTDWGHTDGRFGLAVLLEYCATLGLIDVALSPPWGARDDLRGLWGWDDVSCLSRYDGLHALRLTPLGAWVFGAAEGYTPRLPAPALTIHPTGDILLDDTAAPGVRIQLQRIADPVGADVYRLSAEKILQALESGMAFDGLTRFLRAHTSQPLPSSMCDFLRIIDTHRQTFTLESPGYLISCADPQLTALVCQDARLAGCCLQVNADFLFLRKGREQDFTTVLRALGYVLPGLPMGAAGEK